MVSSLIFLSILYIRERSLCLTDVPCGLSLGQVAFTEEGLSKLWNELVKDGEIEGVGESSNRREEEDIGKARRSPFSILLEGWTWGRVRKGHGFGGRLGGWGIIVNGSRA